MVALLLGSWLSCAPPALADDDWHRYQNAHFDAVSNASERRTRKLLGELENFRAAVIQVMNIPIPDDAKRTTIVIFDSRREFEALTGDAPAGAFLQKFDDNAVIALPASGFRTGSTSLIRHEYAHLVLSYNEFDYPWWFEEGFAELLATVDFIKRDTQFKLGRLPRRADYFNGVMLGWDDLLMIEGSLETDINASLLSNAVLQAWALVHHILLDHDLMHVPQVAKYFYLVANGESDAGAFTSAFEMSPTEMGQPLMTSRDKRIPVYTFDFQPGFRDLEFNRSKVETASVQPLIDLLARAFAEYR
jgi:hypothetical protein